MLKYLLAALTAFALTAVRPAVACDDCQNCPHKKTTVSQADKAGDKKDASADKLPTCACTGGKECKCDVSCTCPHCAAKKATQQKKAEPKKS